MSGPTRKRLEDIRQTLLALHKALLDSERATYEETIGVIASPNHFLKLLTTDPWFAWLQPLSQLIVSIDEALEAEEPLTAAMVDAVAKGAGDMLKASEIGEGFPRHYYDALQRNLDVIVAHGEVMKLLGQRKS